MTQSRAFSFLPRFEPGNTARRLRAPTLVRHAFTRFRKAVRTVTPVRDLLRGVLAYKVAESLYFSFSLAFAYLHHGFIGCLIFFGLQSAGIAVGYYGGLTLFARAPTRARHSLQWAGLVWAASLTATGCFTGTAASAVLLSGSIFGGAAIAVKQWHELTRTSGAVRESYLLLAHSAGSLIRIASLACAAILLACVHGEANLFYVICGALGVVALLWAGPLEVATALDARPRPLAALFDRAYWHSAPFFLLESGSGALRTLVSVTGALAIVKSASAYSTVEAGMSVLSATTAAWLAGRRSAGPDLGRLRAGLLVMAVAWATLAGALVWPILFAVFVVLSALVSPLVSAAYDSLVMQSMANPRHSLQSNAVARELILLVARGGAMAIAYALTRLVSAPSTMLLVVLALTVLLLPVEYMFARRIVVEPFGTRPNPRPLAGEGTQRQQPASPPLRR